MNPSVHPFFHAATGSWSYVATDPATRHAVVIDPVLDFDVKSARTGTALADAILAHVHPAAQCRLVLKRTQRRQSFRR